MECRIRLIAVDLDGTLLTSQKNLSEENRKAIEMCLSRGIYVVPCTGRTAKGIPQEIKKIPGVHYAITVNGGRIEDLQNETVLETHLLDKETAKSIIQLVKHRHVMYDAYINGEGICDKSFYGRWEEYKITPQSQKILEQTRCLVSDFDEYLEKWNGGIDKVNLFFSDLEEREEIRILIKKRGDVLVCSSLENNLEINALEASKGNALLHLAAMLGIKREEIMAFGDGNNDVSMIQNAGIGVAMANGDDELKVIADYITSSNDELGVARAINKYIVQEGGVYET